MATVKIAQTIKNESIVLDKGLSNNKTTCNKETEDKTLIWVKTKSCIHNSTANEKGAAVNEAFSMISIIETCQKQGKQVFRTPGL